LLFGAAFSTFDVSLKARLGYSAAVMTRWNSQSALLCKTPVPRGSASIHVIASIPSQVPPVAVGFHSISGRVRSVLSGQFVSDTNVSLVLDGLVISSVTPDGTGYFVFSNLLDADYVVATHSPGLSPLFATVASSNYPKNYTAAPGPALEQRQSRIVLTWSTFSDDLDAHLLLPDGCKVYVFAFSFLSF
jgi:hypothetical protein